VAEEISFGLREAQHEVHLSHEVVEVAASEATDGCWSSHFWTVVSGRITTILALALLKHWSLGGSLDFQAGSVVSGRITGLWQDQLVSGMIIGLLQDQLVSGTIIGLWHDHWSLAGSIGLWEDY